MTQRLDHAIAKIRSLPDERQDEAAELLLSVASWDAESVALNAEQVAEIERRLSVQETTVPHDQVRTRFDPTDP